MQLLRLAVGLVRRVAILILILSVSLRGPIHDLVPGVLDPLREPVEVCLRPARALAHHAEDAVGPGRVVRRGFAR